MTKCKRSYKKANTCTSSNIVIDLVQENCICMQRPFYWWICYFQFSSQIYSQYQIKSGFQLPDSPYETFLYPNLTLVISIFFQISSQNDICCFFQRVLFIKCSLLCSNTFCFLYRVTSNTAILWS